MKESWINRRDVQSNDSFLTSFNWDSTKTNCDFIEQNQHPYSKSTRGDLLRRWNDELCAELNTWKRINYTLSKKYKDLQRELNLYSFQIDALSQLNKKQQQDIYKLNKENIKLRQNLRLCADDLTSSSK